MKVSVPKSAFLLLFRPDQFRQLVADYSAAQSKERQGQQRTDESFYLKQITLIRQSLFAALWIVLAAVVAGWVTGLAFAKAVGPASPTGLLIIQYLGIGILLLGTLGKRGKDIQTIGGVSLPEQVDTWIYRLLYFLGSYLLVWSATWPIYGS